MSRILKTAAAQLGPIARNESRRSAVARMIELMREAKAAGAHVVVFPELALTTFFPRWYFEDQAEIDGFFEQEMPGPETKPLFDLAASLGVGFYLGYAELIQEGQALHRFNTSILVGPDGQVLQRRAGKFSEAELTRWREIGEASRTRETERS